MLASYDEALNVLVLKQGGKDILLERDVPIEAFEVKVSLLNLLDNSQLVKRVSETIELKDGVYTVKSIGDNTVIVESSDGETMKIIQK